MHTCGQLPQVRDAGPGVVQRPGQQALQGGRVIALLIRQLQAHHHAHQPLLGAVVQVPGQPPPRRVPGRDDPRPGGDELGAVGGVADRGADQLGEPGERSSVPTGSGIARSVPAISAPQTWPPTTTGAPTSDRIPSPRSRCANLPGTPS